MNLSEGQQAALDVRQRQLAKEAKQLDNEKASMPGESKCLLLLLNAPCSALYVVNPM